MENWPFEDVFPIKNGDVPYTTGMILQVPRFEIGPFFVSSFFQEPMACLCHCWTLQRDFGVYFYMGFTGDELPWKMNGNREPKKSPQGKRNSSSKNLNFWMPSWSSRVFWLRFSCLEVVFFSIDFSERLIDEFQELGWEESCSQRGWGSPIVTWSSRWHHRNFQGVAIFLYNHLWWNEKLSTCSWGKLLCHL